MTMLLIEGSFRLVGARPDGDSIRFYPHDVNEWDLVGGPHRVQRNKSGGAQLRLDGIDSLETHFPTSSGEVHQPLQFAQAASAELVKWVGFSKVERNPNDTVTSTTPEQAAGYIFTRGADIHGRCVALVGRGPAPAPSGKRLHVDVAALRKTANHHQLLRAWRTRPSTETCSQTCEAR